jgi:uncharacterized RDD family membrane protein YckC
MTGVIPPPDAPAAAAPPLHHCAECGRPFPDDEMVGYLTAFICAGCKERFFQKLREGARLPGLTEYGGFWIRVGAKVIDSVILGAFVMVIELVLFAVFGASYFAMNFRQPGEPNVPGSIAMAVTLYLLLFVLIFGAQLFYHVWFVMKYGGTPGKMAVQLRIINADGSPLTWKRALARFGAEIFITGLTCNIGYLIAAFDEEKRTLHDHICNTRVVRK